MDDRSSSKARAALRVGFLSTLALGAAFAGGDGREDRFAQLRAELPTPNSYRTASGAPGHAYWQQQVDYVIDVALDDENQRISGTERITYRNNSPDTLRYVWLLVEPNLFSPEAHAVETSLAPNLASGVTFSAMRSMMERQRFDGGAKVSNVTDLYGTPLEHTVVDTTMRIDLPEPLESGETFQFRLDWEYAINDSKLIRGRTGYEFFEEDGNYLYEMAQWFPRLCSYTDYAGWQNKEFLGRGEFTLEFGDYLVSITAPDDHVVASTGVLQNPDECLEPAWKERLEEARTADRPVLIVTREEAEANETTAPEGTKTWTFAAENVRDFAWASSRKFMWDAKLHPVEGGEPVWAMSYWPKEGDALWRKYSTHSVIHTLDVYSKFTFPYPYPVAISVNGPVGGMEYPMICFNGPRPEKDGTYSARSKHGLISVIIHEVGHNWFPMIVNSDERQWTWMDEGLNTFVQFLAESEWQDEYPSRRGAPQKIAPYMTSSSQMPIMTNSESILQFGANAYAKPATALNILRETIMGRELFDFAFKEYSRRWMFKRPEPADLFRTMEDASGVDLDWFWRGWFFTTDHTDMALTGATRWTVDTQDPTIEKERQRAERDAIPMTLSAERNRELPKYVERFPELVDFYNTYDALDVTQEDVDKYESFAKKRKGDELEILGMETRFYVVDIENLGGLPMPVILDVHYEDGEVEQIRVPAEIWRSNATSIQKLVMTDRDVVRFVLDPRRETADGDLSNNVWPPEMDDRRFRVNGGGSRDRGNPMRAARDNEAKKKATAKKDSGGGDSAAGESAGNR
ncbi:MAG: M1 family metallopeptidase [Planctomycetota bacterium]|nr:M1 family metallopeptidase [Planctomycetota bacterium]